MTLKTKTPTWKRTFFYPEISGASCSYNLERAPYYTKNILDFHSLFVVDRRWGAYDSAKNHKRQRRKRQSVTEESRKRQSSYRLG